MKYLFLSILTLVVSNGYGQFELEHTYENAGIYFGNLLEQQFYGVDLEVDGFKYVHINRVEKSLTFYNLDHSFWKSISFQAAIDLNPEWDVMDILYISQHLFDLDDGIEFMYADQNGTSNTVTQIFDEDGSVLFTEINALPGIKLNVPQEQQPIYNTPDGAKMILSLTNGDARVYSLAGIWNEIVEIQSFEFLTTSNPYPNPTSQILTFSYQLPEGCQSGKMVLMDATGSMKRSMLLIGNSQSITMDVSDLGVGTYTIIICTEDELSIARKVVKIN